LDCDPVRVLLLGERLIAFRDTNGRVGLMDQNCPHRGAGLFFGRNEECGLRCVYHGWKFDADGKCVDMPNEPAESDFKDKVKANAYPTRERGGIVWAYLGPRTVPPPLPDLEANMVDGCSAYATQVECNWLQVLEGDVDTIHASFLHHGAQKPEDQPAGSMSQYFLRQRHARFEVVDAAAGVTYGAYRPADEGEQYWRIAQFLFPCWSMAPSGLLGASAHAFCRVPMDDEHTLSFFMATFGPPRKTGEPFRGPLPPVLPNTNDWYGRFRTERILVNDFLIDRTLQRTGDGPFGYTGIQGVATEDMAVTTSMGPIADRSHEKLGSSDAVVIRMRRRLLDAARSLSDRGTVPPGVDEPEGYRQRSGSVVLPRDADWLEATRELRKAFVEHPDLDRRPGGVIP
jgi:phthalate 4,5-dioxygenase oxygenase subunit